MLEIPEIIFFGGGGGGGQTVDTGPEPTYGGKREYPLPSRTVA